MYYHTPNSCTHVLHHHHAYSISSYILLELIPMKKSLKNIHCFEKSNNASMNKGQGYIPTKFVSC